MDFVYGNNPYGSKVFLTTYPDSGGVKPVALRWGEENSEQRGPVIAAHTGRGAKARNAIGAHGGSYSVYTALAIAGGDLPPDFRPDFINTQPTFDFKQQPAWGSAEKIVAMDSFGHIVSIKFKKQLQEGHDIRPTIAITRATMRVGEVAEAVEHGKLPVDGNIVVDKEGNVRATKVAVEPVWYLPGVAKRFNIHESHLRRALFEHMGGGYPELITRPDLKVFLPPIGGLTVYIFGPPERVSDPKCKLALRVHDECNGSDVFQSDICTCRPYLAFGIQEAIREAQQGGSGVCIYFRKEGRALGEVAKYLVYNARKRGGDTADKYFQRTEDVAGHDAIVDSGIPILERIPIPEDMIPKDSRVEIDAKINAGYFTTGTVPTAEELADVKGRGWERWEDVVH